MYLIHLAQSEKNIEISKISKFPLKTIIICSGERGYYLVEPLVHAVCSVMAAGIMASSSRKGCLINLPHTKASGDDTIRGNKMTFQMLPFINVQPMRFPDFIHHKQRGGCGFRNSMDMLGTTHRQKRPSSVPPFLTPFGYRSVRPAFLHPSFFSSERWLYVYPKSLQIVPGLASYFLV